MTLADLLSALTWRDVVDFALLFVLAYAVLRQLKGTRALPVLILVALLAAAGFVARELEIVGVGVLLKYFLEYIIIILIVVFHQELRRLLVRVGQRLMPQSRRAAAETAVETLISSCERLAKARVGALFILEGELDVLEVCTDVGKRIDAPLVTETLVALTLPHSLNTAHDGAILIREFRIDRAGVVCPLSTRDLDPRFGTRHRGAIGVSEECDALVIALSEERGDIRVVEGGVISEPVDSAGLERQIYAWIDRPAPTVAAGAATSRADMQLDADGSELPASASTSAGSRGNG
ncbi:diadenylate cyclase [Enhygromyxa salina]|uniref:Diadenylate cyclase n=1 Tax=Enhygromyxa salina TaxID=215803 RepID=A0A2S9YMV0_9BACT|nr:diadenylate cyclase [Enhygromyxa salina]PRQ06404.1 DisA bacterial checkpoint controller nucleotide-binding protein [Enhygromyxa salina]